MLTAEEIACLLETAAYAAASDNEELAPVGSVALAALTREYGVTL